MAEDRISLTALLAAVQAGSEEAARTLYERFGAHVRSVIRMRLPHRLRSRYDSLDFCQDVWASIFACPPAPDAFDSPEGLVAFLTRIANNKVTGAIRTQIGNQKADVRREEELPAHTADQERLQLFAREPSPSTLAVGKEVWERLLEDQPPLYRRILALIREGKTHEEAAAETGVSAKTVQRSVARAAAQADL
jgi:RNA polymerase sigma-70 factor (ECF subfamily)